MKSELEEVKDRKKSAIKKKLEKDLCHLAEGNKDADKSVDYGGSRLYISKRKTCTHT
jgi:hypothetical protein